MKINAAINRFLYFFLTLNFLPLLFLPSCPHWWIIYCHFSYIFQENEVTDYTFAQLLGLKCCERNLFLNLEAVSMTSKMTTEMVSKERLSTTPLIQLLQIFKTSCPLHKQLLSLNESRYFRETRKATIKVVMFFTTLLRNKCLLYFTSYYTKGHPCLQFQF